MGTLLVIALVIMKLTGNLDASWFDVTAPLLFDIAISVISLACMVGMVKVCHILRR